MERKLQFNNYGGSRDKGYVAFEVNKIQEDSLDSIPSPSSSVKIQIKGGKVGLKCKGKTLLGAVNKILGQNCAQQCFAEKIKNKKFKCS